MRFFSRIPFKRDLVRRVGVAGKRGLDAHREFRGGRSAGLETPILLYEALYGGFTPNLGEISAVVLVAQDARAAKISLELAREYSCRLSSRPLTIARPGESHRAERLSNETLMRVLERLRNGRNIALKYVGFATQRSGQGHFRCPAQSAVERGRDQIECPRAR